MWTLAVWCILLEFSQEGRYYPWCIVRMRVPFLFLISSFQILGFCYCWMFLIVWLLKLCSWIHLIPKLFLVFLMVYRLVCIGFLSNIYVNLFPSFETETTWVSIFVELKLKLPTTTPSDVHRSAAEIIFDYVYKKLTGANAFELVNNKIRPCRTVLHTFLTLNVICPYNIISPFNVTFIYM